MSEDSRVALVPPTNLGFHGWTRLPAAVRALAGSVVGPGFFELRRRATRGKQQSGLLGADQRE